MRCPSFPFALARRRHARRRAVRAARSRDAGAERLKAEVPADALAFATSCGRASSRSTYPSAERRSPRRCPPFFAWVLYRDFRESHRKGHSDPAVAATYRMNRKEQFDLIRLRRWLLHCKYRSVKWSGESTASVCGMIRAIASDFASTERLWICPRVQKRKNFLSFIKVSVG